ncbi:hypothetical protein BH18VER1_BH18VER1_16250 [soil metagenome]
MVIVGPYARNDFHLVDSEEYYYQLQGISKSASARATASLIISSRSAGAERGLCRMQSLSRSR